MQETFRPSKRARGLGTVFVAIYLLACAAYGSLFFINDPFGEGRSGSWIGVCGLSVFGPMLIMSCFLLASCYVEQFSIDGNKLTVRSILQSIQFEIADVESLQWTIVPSIGVRFHAGDAQVRLKLFGYEKADRLRIIRTLRGIVPAEAQVGWPMFCHKVALPLRDGKSPLSRVEPSATSFHVTRRRYKRALLVAMPASVAVALFVADRLQMKEWLALPGLVALALILLRSSTPKNGRTEWTFNSRWGNRATILGVMAILGSTAAMLVLKFCDLESATWAYLPIGVGLALFPPMLFCLVKADKERLIADQVAAELAVIAWRDDEPIDWTGEAN